MSECPVISGTDYFCQIGALISFSGRAFINEKFSLRRICVFVSGGRIWSDVSTDRSSVHHLDEGFSTLSEHTFFTLEIKNNFNTVFHFSTSNMSTLKQFALYNDKPLVPAVIPSLHYTIAAPRARAPILCPLRRSWIGGWWKATYALSKFEASWVQSVHPVTIHIALACLRASTRLRLAPIWFRTWM